LQQLYIAELLKGVVTFTEGRVAGSIALSLQNDAKDAEEKLWVMIYSKTGDEMVLCEKIHRTFNPFLTEILFQKRCFA